MSRWSVTSGGVEDARMLLLGRRPGEGVTLILEDGREIRVEVVEQHRFAVRLGFHAPRSIRIYRDECLREQRDQRDPRGQDQGDKS